MKDQIKWVLNTMPKSDDRQLPIMSLSNVAKARFFHSTFPQYSVTPLDRLDGMAQYLGLAGLCVKNESFRFGLNAFKVLGGSFAMARYIAKNIVAAGLAEKCTVSLAYAIGRAEPVAVDIDTHGTGVYSSAVLEQAVRAAFDLTPSGIIRTLKLDHPMFAQFCNYGHFTYPEAPWEQTDRTELLENVCRAKEAGVSDR